MLAPGELSAIVDRIAEREVDPYTAASELVARTLAHDRYLEVTKSQEGPKGLRTGKTRQSGD